MLTRRNALAVVPAGLLLEASFVRSAEAQAAPQPIPPFLRVAPARLLDAIIKRRKPGISYDKSPDPDQLDPRGLIEFVRICAEPGRLQRNFANELSVTTQILEFFSLIFDVKFPANKEFSEFTTQVTRMAAAIERFLANYIDQERRESSNDRFLKNYADNMD